MPVSPLQIPDFYCCLNSDERNILRTLAITYPVISPKVLPGSVWLALWATVEQSSTDRQAIFIDLFWLHLEPECGLPDPEESCLVYDGTDFWTAISIWILTPPAACANGCSLPDWP